MVLSPGGQSSPDPVHRRSKVLSRPRSGRLRIPLVVAIVFGGASLASVELFSRFSEGGAPFLLALVALLPLQAVALVWLLSQRRPSSSSQG